MVAKTFIKPILYTLIGITLVLAIISGKVLILDQRAKQSVKGLTSETVNTPTPFPTIALNETIESTPTEAVNFIPTRKPIPTLTKNSPTSTTTQPSNVQVQYVPVTQPPTQNTSQDDAYLDYLHELQAENEKKRLYCQELYAEVTASLQPLLSERDRLNQIYSDAITSGNADRIGKAQSDYWVVWTKVNEGYQQNYYSVCP